MKNIDPIEIALVEDLVKKCVKHLAKKEYDLNLPNNAVEIALNVLKIKKRPNTPSRAGANVIQINLDYWQMNNPVAIEYKAYNDDPIIGQIAVTRKYDQLLVMVAHEVAHHIQYRYCPKVDRFRYTYRKPHGDCFKAIYRYLRKDLVNPMIEARYEEIKKVA